MAETIAETPKTNIAKMKANKYVSGTYPTPLGSGILNMNEIENEDYRIGKKGQYLFADTAIEKFQAYKSESSRSKKKVI
ncbi:hypothetical protein [Acetivibrio ethanolgignens]|uniref:Uncharacterized protein n=1 Tax=Acetivibrio ethanolgignens TaxID=290052 RepID=A0A0V8QAU2_9FIRM|nr:hypothetical protein [Acetivibrio ethanolgignens]KSV57693.1 hypothetical protein ASU35_15625 [Acetivibrio ethanolgignens]